MGEDDALGRRIQASETRLQKILILIGTMTALVEADPTSCLHYTTAFNFLDWAAGQSEPAAEPAARAHKRTDDAHMEAVPEGKHDPRCVLAPPGPAQDEWIGLGTR